MGQIFQGILGGFSGKVGTVIGYVRNGVAFMRGMATGHTDANTSAQQIQRAKFSLVVRFLRPLTALLRIGFKEAGSRLTGYNSAMAYTMENAVTGISPDFAIDYAKVLVCRGNLPGALNPEVTSAVAGQVDFTWENNDWDAGADADDKVVLVVYNPAKQKAISVIGDATRATGNQSVEVPELFSADNVQCYIGFTNASQSEFSNGEFVDAVVVQ